MIPFMGQSVAQWQRAGFQYERSGVRIPAGTDDCTKFSDCPTLSDESTHA